MKLVYMGSPEEVISPLKALLALGEHEVVGIVSQPARAVGRTQQLQDPPLAAFAKAQNLLTLQPVKASDPAFLEHLKALHPDVIITAAYGQLLTEAFLAIPKLGTINLHPSLLPKYRGATPVQAALLHGETETGMTILHTVRKLDAGAIILQEKAAIDPEEAADTLLRRLFELGASLLPEALRRLEHKLPALPQDEAQISHCTKIHKEDGEIAWHQDSREIFNRFRAFQPWPGLFTYAIGKRVVVTGMRRHQAELAAGRPGTYALDPVSKDLVVRCGTGSLAITKVKPAGGKEQTGQVFWNGQLRKEAGTFQCKKLVVAISGGGRTLQNLLDASLLPNAGFRVIGVISSSPEIAGNAVAKAAGLPLFTGNFKKVAWQETAENLAIWLDAAAPDLIALAGFLAPFPLNHRFKDQVLNIHPSLLPRHGGKGMYGIHVHKAVIASGDLVTGATVHRVTPEYDEGKVLGQVRVKVTTADPEVLSKEVFAAECTLYPRVINQVLSQSWDKVDDLAPILYDA